MWFAGAAVMRRYKATGRRLLIEALRQQPTLGCCEPTIKKLAQLADLKTYRPGTHLTIQDSDDNRLAFILSGRVGVLVKGEKIAERRSGQHIGEMSVIDPSARRSATATAIEPTTVAWIKEKDFSQIATANPYLWRNLARELADRLRQRGILIRDKNTRPVVFIGSSSESLKVAQIVRKSFSNDLVTIKLWKRGVFGASEATIESLEKMASRADFAVLILTADDKVRLRRKNIVAPRDNVVFELGLFMGAIGRNRTFMLVEKKTGLRRPPDLEGVTYLPFAMKDKKPVGKDIAEAISQIRTLISELNVR